MMSHVAALEQQLEWESMEKVRAQHAEQRAADCIAALEQQVSTQSKLLEQAEKRAAELAGQLEQEGREKLNLQWKMDLTGHAVVQATPAQDENRPMADSWRKQHPALAAAVCMAGNVCQNGRCEELS